ncbi:hypothetical protein Tco_0327583, partial [Tanacetum coccineum]
GFEIAASDVKEDDEEFEVEASAADTREIVVDPLAISDSSESSRGGIPNLKDTIYDIDHYMLEVRIDRIAEIETTQRQLETSQLVASGERASLVERIGSLRLENLKVRAMLSIKRDWIDRLCWHMALSQEEFRQVRRDRDDTRRRLRRLESSCPPKTAKQKLARKNELKAKSTLLLAIPDEHYLKFSLWNQGCKRPYGKQSSVSRSKGLDKTYDWFQKLISQMEIHGEVISQEDANLKLLRSLPSAWNNIALIIRNKSDLDILSIDDLYNNLKVYESEIKGQSSSSLISQNVAFVSSENTSSTVEN